MNGWLLVVSKNLLKFVLFLLYILLIFIFIVFGMVLLRLIIWGVESVGKLVDLVIEGLMNMVFGVDRKGCIE